MTNVELALASLFVWVIGVLYVRGIVYQLRSRTDWVAIGFWPFWRKDVVLASGGIAHRTLTALHWLGLAFNVLIGIPIALFFMAMLPWLFIKTLLNG